MEEFKGKSKIRTTTIMLLIIILTFGVSLYLVEWSSIGSQSLGQYNNGYGTFDMKYYSKEIVSNVLKQMEPEGFVVYKKYFIADYFFILTFGTLQITLLTIVYRWINKKSVLYLICSIPVLRGVCDLVENTLLLIILNEYPKLNDNLIMTSSVATRTKLLMIKIWVIVLVGGIVGGIVKKHQKIKNM